MNKQICRVCGAVEPKQPDLNAFYEGWLIAIPSNMRGRTALQAAEWWCCQECQNSDPQFEAEPMEAVAMRIAPDKAGPVFDFIHSIGLDNDGKMV